MKKKAVDIAQAYGHIIPTRSTTNAASHRIESCNADTLKKKEIKKGTQQTVEMVWIIVKSQSGRKQITTSGTTRDSP